MSSCECGFDVGDRVSFPGGDGEISKVDHRDGNPCLLHIHTEEGPKTRPTALPIQRIDTGSELIAKSEFGKPSHFDLLQQAAELDLTRPEDRFVALSGSRIDIEPYQVQAAYEILTSYDHRYLIGDEVGLGKTIEAAIVIEELIARDRASRVLIVTPAPLTEQWQAEMREKFDREYMVYEREYVEAKRKATPSANIWEEDDRIITSIDFAKQDDMLAALKNLDAEWDIAVFDEAHHLTARRDSEGNMDRTERYRVGEAVSENSDGLIFLTGTPHKGKPDQFFFMLQLLDRYRFRDEHDITPDGLEDLMIRRLKEDMYETDGTPMFPEKNIETLPVQFSQEERKLYEAVTDYITENYDLAGREDSTAVGFAMAIYQKRLVSSIYAIQKSLEKRKQAIQAGGKDPDDLSQAVRSLLPQYREDPELLTDVQRERLEEELGTVSVARNEEQLQQEYEIVSELHQQAKSIETDRKAEELQKYIDGVLKQDPEEKILVFTEYTDTLEYLRDRIFADMDVAEIYGDLGTTQRREQMEKFREEANVMLATDAAREGINLQFAHIMVNYDLPWNPTRIDQRIGRLHRYGQDQTVQIRNLFVENTRESEILELLLEKIDEIEMTLGMNSDVLGLVLDDFDLESQIMSAVESDNSASEVAADIDRQIEQQKDAIRRIEDDFLIRDRFDLSAEDGEILDVLERSREESISEDDVRTLVRSFFEEFGGELRGAHPGPVREGGDVFRLDVPVAISGGQVDDRYERATFTREIAVEKDDIEFIAPDHPLIERIVEFTVGSGEIDGETAIKVSADAMNTPGLLCNFRLRYLSGSGETVTERLQQIYVTPEGTVQTDEIELVGGIPPENAGSFSGIDPVSENAESLMTRAEDRAWELVTDVADEAAAERSREVAIKREHTEQYFESKIAELQERLEARKERDREEDTDMTPEINRIRSQIGDLEQERDAELQQLEIDEQVVPDEPELVNVAVVIGA
ncbi:DEAD/DEAH box helicase [Salinarchaeum laminariae]|uniref:DEAD/DEAH box helicase n=1 Tax=Salinarchaeum laminariae TaxID=869888 RepID=UPI00202B799B|nr:helicase-related protein [Salinarchaeum laminariae]